MPIKTVNLFQQGVANQAQFHKRELARAADQTSEEAVLTSQLSTNSDQLLNAHSLSSKEGGDATLTDETYARPLPPKLALLKQLVVAIAGKNFDLADDSFKNLPVDQLDINTTDLKQPNTHASLDIVTIEGQAFMAQQQLLVTETTLFKQQLNYDMQGSFNFNGEQRDVSLSVQYQYEFERVSEFYLSAAQLVDPLVIQYGPNAIGEVENGVEFNLNAQHQHANLPMFSGDVGYLVYDKNANGKADNGSELFGPTTQFGFNELAQLDDNGDGFISNEDGVFSQLYLWKETADTTHWQSLADAGIEAIYLTAVNTPYFFYDEDFAVQAKIRQTSFAISSTLGATPVHQIDISV